MVQMSVKVDFGSVLSQLAADQKQVAYGAALGITTTARRAKDAMPAILERVLDRPTSFTKRGFYVTPANKVNLSAVIGVMDAQAKYLQWQIDGGVRAPDRKALKLPSAIGLNQFGNIPRGLIQQLIAVAQKETKLGKRKSRTIKVSNKVELFYGDPADVGMHKFPPGIYKRVDLGGRHQLIPLIVFPAVSAHYKKRFDFYGEVKKIVDDNLQKDVDAGIAEAMRTAR